MLIENKKKDMKREEVKDDFKVHLITYLNLLDITPDQIKDDEPLFGSDVSEIGLRDLCNGIYLLEVISEGKNWKQQLIVQH